MVDRTHSRRRRFAGNGVLLLAGLTVALLAVEAVVRAINLDPGIHVIYRKNYRLSENPRLQYELQPLSKDGAGLINSVGMRDDEYPLAKPTNNYRIVIVGDSVTYGLTVAQPDAFPQQLEKMLKTRAGSARNYEVLNLGVSGYNIDQVIERLRTLGLSYSPDLVIYAYSINDPQTYSLEMEGLVAVHQDAVKEFHPRRTLMRWFSRSRVFLLAWRSLQQPWTSPAKPVRRSPDYEAMVSGRHVEYFEELHSGESWKRVEEGFSKLSEVPEGEGPRVLLAVLPLYLGESATYPLSQLHHRIVAEARRNHLEAVDLSSSLVAGSEAAETKLHEYFNDPFHLSTRGNQQVATGLLDWLEGAGVLTATMQP